MAALYLVAVGVGLALYAANMGGGDAIMVDPFGSSHALGPTPLQRYYGVFGGITLVVGVMALLFGALSWAFNLLATIITMSVMLGCMALVVVLSLMSGLETDLRDKILAQKAHIRIARADGRPFENYLSIADLVGSAGAIAGASPYLEGEIMVRSGLNRQAAMLTGIIPERQTLASNLEQLVEEGAYRWLEHPDEIPDPDPFSQLEPETPWRLRHLEEQRKKARESVGAAKTSGREVAPEEDLAPPPPGWEDPAAGAAGAAADEPRDVGLPGVLDEPRAVGHDEGPEPPKDDPDDRLRPPQGWEDPVAHLGIEPEPREKPRAVPAQQDEPQAVETEGAVLDPILIGRELAMELGVRVGSQVQLITPIGRMTPAGRIPGVMGAKVAGVFYSGMYEYDRKNVYLPLSVAQAFLRAGDRVSGIEVRLEDVDDIDNGKREVASIVADLEGGEELIVEDWRDLNRNLFSAMFLEKVAMFIALLFVVLVASFGILASNLMSVMEKSKEIAILKAMGSTDAGILRVFVAEGLCVGLLGSFGGISLGLALCWALDRFGLPLNESVYYIEKLPVVVNPAEVTLIGVSALVIVWLSSLYPARIASRMRPVDGLRQAER